jgi:predicted RNA polymerase sigma factor
MQPHLRQLAVALSPEESAIVRRIHRAKSFIFLREQRFPFFSPDFQAELAATLYDDSSIWHPPR